MGRPRKFDAEFRGQAVELVRMSGRPRCQVASDLGISDTTLARWMVDEQGDQESKLLSLSERDELQALRQEKREWVVERALLKKTAAFFVRECQG